MSTVRDITCSMCIVRWRAPKMATAMMVRTPPAMLRMYAVLGFIVPFRMLLDCCCATGAAALPVTCAPQLGQKPAPSSIGVPQLAQYNAARRIGALLSLKLHVHTALQTGPPSRRSSSCVSPEGSCSGSIADRDPPMLRPPVRSGRSRALPSPSAGGRPSPAPREDRERQRPGAERRR